MRDERAVTADQAFPQPLATDDGTPEQRLTDAEAAGKTMAFEGFPRLVPLAFRDIAAAWLAGYDQASGARRKSAGDEASPRRGMQRLKVLPK